MPKIDIDAVPGRKGSSYPAPFHEMAKTRIKQALGNAGGLMDFGVNLVRLPPGAWSSQRHWHSVEDEFVYLISGELVLITEADEHPMHAGDCAAFPKNTADGHHLINRSGAEAVYLEVGARTATDVCSYSDIDLRMAKQEGWYTHKDGTFYPAPD